jgi:hypothetical protein
MRLAVVERGHTLRTKAAMVVRRVLSRRRVPDIVRTLWYRPSSFGKPISAWTQAVMRGDSDWSVGERELFAAFTSHLNKCRF